LSVDDASRDISFTVTFTVEASQIIEPTGTEAAQATDALDTTEPPSTT
jgi:hypothetical protein